MSHNFSLDQLDCHVPLQRRLREAMPDQEGPALIKGDIWRTSRPGSAREIVGHEAGPDGERRIRYRTRSGEFICSEREFWFWIERRFASPTSAKIGDILGRGADQSELGEQ
jgi:hypothetical protein